MTPLRHLFGFHLWPLQKTLGSLVVTIQMFLCMLLPLTCCSCTEICTVAIAHGFSANRLYTFIFVQSTCLQTFIESIRIHINSCSESKTKRQTDREYITDFLSLLLTFCQSLLLFFLISSAANHLPLYETEPCCWSASVPYVNPRHLESH